MSVLRWWAGKTGKPNLIAKDNKSLGIANRQYVPEHSKARHITPEQLQQIKDQHLRTSFQLQQAFGLRREECLKFQPAYADKGNHIELKGSWTKGGRPRTIPILNQHQREILDQAHRIAGNDSLIPNHKTYSQQRNYYDHQCRQLALRNMHGVRHMYAQHRYEELTGWKCPLAGGPKQKDLTARQKPADRSARQIISHEMGHNRPGIVVQYIGR